MCVVDCMRDRFIDLDELLILATTEGVKLRFKDRKALCWNDYHSFNHAYIIGYTNIADHDCWDAMVFGYEKEFSFHYTYTTNKLLGIVCVPTGNHKLLFKCSDRGFTYKRFKKQLLNYIKHYEKENTLKIVYINLEK